MSKKGYSGVRLLSVGHGTLSREAFTALLAGAQVQVLLDVRRFPGSRRHPHFAKAAMARWLPDAAVGYRHVEALGGRRSPAPASPHTALRNAGFRAYADHMATPAFTEALRAALEEAAVRRTAILCAESLWWRCHRRLVADAATLLHGAEVRHLMHDGRLAPHVPTEAARVEGAALVYASSEPPALPGL